MNHCNELNVT